MVRADERDRQIDGRAKVAFRLRVSVEELEYLAPIVQRTPEVRALASVSGAFDSKRMLDRNQRRATIAKLNVEQRYFAQRECDVRVVRR